MPDDLAKLSNVVKNDTVKKVDFSLLKTKVDNIDTSNFVLKSKFGNDAKDLDDKIDKVNKKVPDITNLATKSSSTSLLPTSAFNSKITEVENKIETVDGKIPDTSNLATKTELTSVENKIPSTDGFFKKTDYATEITSIKNDYVTNAAFDSKINDLKSHHIAGEAKKVDDKTKKNVSDILRFENRLKQKEDIVDEGQRENSFARGFYYYLQQNYLVYEYRYYSFKNNANNKITAWKSTSINNLSVNSISDTTLLLPSIENDGRMNVKFSGNYFLQNKFINPNASNIVNIYIVYKLDAISSTRNTDYTIQNALFGAVKITKNASDSSKSKYEGYRICFDEGGTFSKGNINNGRNVLIFGVVESCLTHSTNKANNIYVFGNLFVQGINNTTLYAEKVYKTNFAVPNVKSVLSLHYNGDNSYFFVNGTQELKFKAKASQILKEKLCVGNLSSNWSNSKSQKQDCMEMVMVLLLTIKKLMVLNRFMTQIGT